MIPESSAPPSPVVPLLLEQPAAITPTRPPATSAPKNLRIAMSLPPVNAAKRRGDCFRAHLHVQARAVQAPCRDAPGLTRRRVLRARRSRQGHHVKNDDNGKKHQLRLAAPLGLVV